MNGSFFRPEPPYSTNSAKESGMKKLRYKSLQSILNTVFIPIALVGLSFAVLYPYMPPHYINRDSGIFLYIGRQMTLGKSLYVDMWDHKGPLLFYLNALGYWAGKRTGVWFIECIFLSTSAIAGYTVLKKILSSLFALMGTAAWLYSFFFIIAGGNFTEEFSLPMSFLSIFFLYEYINNERKIYPVLIGIAMGLSAMLRPNNIGVQLVVSAIIVVSSIWKAKIRNICLISAGALLIVMPVFLFFYIKGTFYEFLNATILFNFLYANERGAFDFSVIIMYLIILGWPSWCAIAGWFFVLRDVLSKNRALPAPIACLLLIGFPLEIFLDTLSGRPYAHYVIMLLPYIGLLSAFFLFKLLPFIKRQKKLTKISAFMLGISMLLFSFWSSSEFIKRLDETSPQINENSEIVSFIKNNTAKSDYVLVWGQELSINVLSERESPTPFGHQTYFLIKGMVTPEVEQIFLSNLEKNKPAMVIITDALPFLDQDPENFETQLQSVTPNAIHVFRSFSEYVNQNYHKVKTIQNFKIFILNK